MVQITVNPALASQGWYLADPYAVLVLCGQAYLAHLPLDMWWDQKESLMINMAH